MGMVSAKEFITFLRYGAEASESQENELSLPSVQTLIFDTVQFSHRDVEDLRIFLVHRMNRRKPVSHLGFNHCNGFDADRLSDLECLVVSIWVVDNNVMVDR